MPHVLDGPAGHGDLRQLQLTVRASRLATAVALPMALASACSMALPTVVARDDPNTAACAPRNADTTVQFAVSFVENVGSEAVTLSEFDLVRPSSEDLAVIGAYLATPESSPVTGAPFDRALAGQPVVLGPGAKELLVFGVALEGTAPAKADGVSFAYEADGQGFRGRTNVAFTVETAAGC